MSDHGPQTVQAALPRGPARRQDPVPPQEEPREGRSLDGLHLPPEAVVLGVRRPPLRQAVVLVVLRILLVVPVP